MHSQAPHYMVARRETPQTALSVKFRILQYPSRRSVDAGRDSHARMVCLTRPDAVHCGAPRWRVAFRSKKSSSTDAAWRACRSCGGRRRRCVARDGIDAPHHSTPGSRHAVRLRQAGDDGVLDEGHAAAAGHAVCARPDGTISTIAANAVPFSTAEIVSAEPIRAVIEINGGLARALGIAPGDRVRAAIFPRSSQH